MSSPPPNTSLQRAFAYAPKPFAALSFLSSIFIFYYLIIRHPEKRKRMYHRLILATCVSILLKSVAYFWGTWAIPRGTLNTVGASGTDFTCAVEGFILTLGWAVSLYCGSLSIYSFVAVKNNFQQEKYLWIEKWIHAVAAILPLSSAVYGAALNRFHPGHAYCRLASMTEINECSGSGSDGSYCGSRSTLWIQEWIILVSFFVSTSIMLFLWYSFERIQKDVDAAVGVKKITESFRKKRLKQVAIQTGLYLFANSVGDFSFVIWILNSFISGDENYVLQMVAHCLSAAQGFAIMIVYFSLQLKRNKESYSVQTNDRPGLDKQSVESIRLNAAKPKPLMSTRLSTMLSGRFSFNIFDGVPAEDSPWAKYLEEDSDEFIASTLRGETDIVCDSQLSKDNELSSPLLRANKDLEWETTASADCRDTL